MGELSGVAAYDVPTTPLRPMTVPVARCSASAPALMVATPWAA
jgi:hypothetical protein